MLYSVPDLKGIESVPRTVEYRRGCTVLDEVDLQAYQRIHDELHARSDGREVDTSSWIPGSDWTGTVFQPIYEACGEDQRSSRSITICQTRSPKNNAAAGGSSCRYEKESIPIRGMTYFRIDCPAGMSEALSHKQLIEGLYYARVYCHMIMCRKLSNARTRPTSIYY